MEEARLEYLMEKEVSDTGAVELLQVDDGDWDQMQPFYSLLIGYFECYN
jgi:hypothetical protein